MKTYRENALAFDDRIARVVHGAVGVGEPLKGRWGLGASFRLPSSGDGGAIHDYARQGHPGGHEVEKLLAAIEMGDHALCFSDGMHAIKKAVESVVRPGDSVLVHSSIYGGSIRYFNRLREWNVEVTFTDLSQENAAQKIADHRPTLVFLESITNPLLVVLDLPLLMSTCASIGAYTVVDNTLATGFASVPTEIARQVGYDRLMVALSLTKGYTAGELGGAVITDNAELADRLYRSRQAEGGNASPTDAPRFMEGLKSMGPRMARLSENSQAVVNHLRANPVAGINVHYPSEHPLLLRAPGVFTLECELPEDEYQSLIGRLENFFIRSNSFNGHLAQLSESSRQSHGSVKDSDQKAAAGIKSQLIRLSPSSTWSAEGLVNEFSALLG